MAPALLLIGMTLTLASFLLADRVSPDGRVGGRDVMPDDADAFAECVDPHAVVEEIATGLRFTEGPVWVGTGTPGLAEDVGRLVFSDIPADTLYVWDERDGLRVFRTPSGQSNGNTLDREGRLLTAEHANRRVTRTEPDGNVTVLADAYDGKKLNSPNDLVVTGDGVIWFTDPPYGLPRPKWDELREQKGHFVFRLNPETGALRIVGGGPDSGIDRPNGLAFSPDERHLYVADSGRGRQVWRFDVAHDGSLTNGDVFARPGVGFPDGMRVDVEGRLWTTAGDGVHVYAPDGRRLGCILFPQSPANLCFGGEDGQTLFVTARTSVYRVPVRTTQALRPSR